ncbi:MAG: BTAD domain-containing putative transcriptional regulator [Anaerolineae bacterium]
MGGFEVCHGDQPIADFESQKVRALFAYLILHPGIAPSRDRLAGLLWPEKSDETARRNLRQAVYNLRTTLPHSDTPEPPILTTHQNVQFNPETDYWLDITAFEDRIRRGMSVSAGIGPSDLADASELYRGDFLAGFFVSDSPDFEHWLLYEQERLREMAIQALRRLVDYYLAYGEYDGGIRYARRLLDIDPLFEEAHRNLMRLYALSGRRSRALAQYDDCRRLLRDELGVEPLDETMSLYRAVLAEEWHDEVSVVDGATTTGPHIPFVGREAAYARLRRSWEVARQGMGRLTLVEGEAGIGKTELVERFILDAAARSQAIVLSGRCYESAPPAGYQPVADALRRVVMEQPQIVQNAAPSLPPRRLSGLMQIVPGLRVDRADLLGPPPALDGTRAQLFDSLVCFLEALVQTGDLGRPADSLILFLDDLHWADRPSLEFLQHLIGRLDGQPIWIVAAYRPGHLDSEHPLLPLRRQLSRDYRVDRVALDRLNFADIQRIATAIVGDAQAGVLARFLDRESAGLPLTTAELINYLRDEGVLVNHENHRWSLASPLPALATPTADHLDELILGRVSQLPTSARRLLTLAAVAGPRFNDDLLQKADGEHLAVVEAGIVTWLQRRLIRPVSREWRVDSDAASQANHSHRQVYEFAHDTIRHAIYHDVSRQRRKVMHRQLAAALEDQHAEDTREVCEELAHHYLAADAWSDALTYLRQAGDKARQSAADETALHYYDQVLQVLDWLEDGSASEAERQAYLEQRFQVLTSRSEMYQARGVRERQEADLQSMRDIMKQLDDSECLSSLIAQLGESQSTP